jgi:hypothetical protein
MIALFETTRPEPANFHSYSWRCQRLHDVSASPLCLGRSRRQPRIWRRERSPRVTAPAASLARKTNVRAGSRCEVGGSQCWRRRGCPCPRPKLLKRCMGPPAALVAQTIKLPGTGKIDVPAPGGFTVVLRGKGFISTTGRRLGEKAATRNEARGIQRKDGSSLSTAV